MMSLVGADAKPANTRRDKPTHTAPPTTEVSRDTGWQSMLHRSKWHLLIPIHLLL